MKIEHEKSNVERYVALVGDILNHEQVQRMATFRHHQETHTHFHSVFVSYTVMKVCARLHHPQEREIVRAALLHDFYLYEWYTEKHEENHIWYHPKEAVKNAETYLFPLSAMQKNMILSHMFPTCVEWPCSSGAWILTFCDKRCATQDYLKLSRRFLPIYHEISRKVEQL